MLQSLQNVAPIEEDSYNWAIKSICNALNMNFNITSSQMWAISALNLRSEDPFASNISNLSIWEKIITTTKSCGIPTLTYQLDQ